MSEKNFFTDFNESFGFDESLLQTGKSKTETGYLQNEEALTFFRKKQADWNNISMVTAALLPFGFLGLPLIALFGGIGVLSSIELSRPIDRIVFIMEMLLDEFKEEGITLTPNIKTKEGLIDLFIKTADGRHFALLLRSNGNSRVKWREDRQEFYTVGKGRNSKWSRLELLGDQLNRMILCFKEEKNPLFGSSNAERKKPFTRAIILTGKTRLDPNNDPALMVSFGRTTALRMMAKPTYYLADRENLANFIRKPIIK